MQQATPSRDWAFIGPPPTVAPAGQFLKYWRLVGLYKPEQPISRDLQGSPAEKGHWFFASGRTEKGQKT